MQKDENIHNKEEEKEKKDTQEAEEDFPRPETNTLSRRIQKNHLDSQIMGDKNDGVKTRRQLPSVEQALLSIVEQKNFTEASKIDEWVKAMNEELDQIEKNETWELVPRNEDKNIVGTKWIFKNKFNQDGQVINKEQSRIGLQGVFPSRTY